MGLVDILSRNPSGLAPHIDQDDEQLVVAKIDNLIRGIEMKDMKALTNSTNQSRVFRLERNQQNLKSLRSNYVLN